jgi:hypothetical protein
MTYFRNRGFRRSMFITFGGPQENASQPFLTRMNGRDTKLHSRLNYTMLGGLPPA